KLNLRFFFYALKNSNLERWTITTSIPGINRDDIYKTKIPLPPIDEQRRIAAILDQADAIRRKRQKAIALTDELLRSTFLEMFGDLVY
ncbi:MAG: restriction endonuclease subunit S, partial [Trichodesmium sp. St2_bin2_1]|nr:restriction endonuclease subunit S [Trichodesmium sp. St2_bin2_1]